MYCEDRSGISPWDGWELGGGGEYGVCIWTEGGAGTSEAHKTRLLTSECEEAGGRERGVKV